ncbi:unnamed protein product [Ilex paraguariensis]|uniref:PRONE domain-containing protein n=1 Tax=Ilex paraguariensis TaxID=185542 RepID=A0ABC8UTT0_9AQUA
MERALSYIEEPHVTTQRTHQQLKLCFPGKYPSSNNQNPFSLLAVRVSKSLRNLCRIAKVSNGFCCKKLHFTGMVVNNSVYCASPYFLETKMEGLVEKSEGMEGIIEVFDQSENKIETFVDVIEEECRQSSSSSDFLASEAKVNEEHSSSEDSSLPLLMYWPIQKCEVPHCAGSDVSEDVGKPKPNMDDRKLEKQGSSMSEAEMMKERFSKLLLGEDMSGCGNGVCTALTISNSITNLCATLFGQIWRLEPLPLEKKLMWRREMEWILCVSDHIVELIPSLQTFPDGSKLEVMTIRPRSDLYVNLPALRKLDSMLLVRFQIMFLGRLPVVLSGYSKFGICSQEILDNFGNTEFWYVDQGVLATEAGELSSFRKLLPRQEEKWWLPVPRVPFGGLSKNARKQLQHNRDCTNQILKAAMAINSITLAEMEIPEPYLEALPKNGKASLGDLIYRYISSDQFSPDCLLDCIDLSSEHQALEIANRVESSIYVWHRKNQLKALEWHKLVKFEVIMGNDKRELLAERAESLLLRLKQHFPGLPQTTLDMNKIQYNKDVGKSILESYSRVLESLAFNIVARIDDLLYVDELTKHSDQCLAISKVGMVAHQNVRIPYAAPILSTPYKTAFTTPSFSPSQRISSTKAERSPFLDSTKLPHHGVSVKKVLTDYLSIDTKGNIYSNQIEGSNSFSSTTQKTSASQRIF